MVKKLKELAEDKELANAVRYSAQQIWQAGLGAFAKAQEEGGRVFSRLVKEGTEFQQRAEDKVAGVSESVGKLADGVGKQASGSWDKLEQVFEERVARALATIGVPTQHEIAALHAKIDALQQQVLALSAQPAAAKAAKPAVKPSVKRAAKPAAKPAAKAPGVKPAAKPAAKAATKAVPDSVPQAAAVKPAAKAAVKPAAKPATKPVTKPATKPVTKPATKPVARPAAKAASRPAAKKKAPAA